MVLINIFIRILLISNLNSSCEEFKFGTFKIYDNNELQYTLVRTENHQTEVDFLYEEKTYYNIEWIDKCSFIQTFDDKKMILTDEMALINKDGGIVVELIEKTSDKCYKFKSYIKNFKEISIRTGYFCK